MDISNTNEIVNIGAFLQKEFEKKNTEILCNLKKEVANAINFFLNKNNNVNYDELINNISEIKLIGYEHINKIKSGLDILEIKDKNQTNKFEYEKCLSLKLIVNLTYFSSYFEELRKLIIDIDIEKNITLLETQCKINENDMSYERQILIDSLYRKTESLFDEKIKLKKNEILGEYTIFINQIISTLFSIKEILKDITINNIDCW